MLNAQINRRTGKYTIDERPLNAKLFDNVSSRLILTRFQLAELRVYEFSSNRFNRLR
jgi:hypothetical protein